MENTPTRYEIRDRLGAGGLGEVFRAWDSHLGREVAIKRLRDSRKDEETWREAQILAALHHPNLVTVYDFGRDYAGSFVVMELVEGVNLEDLVPHGGVSLEFFQEFADQICRGLAAAHARRVVHRDLKPGNIMIQHHQDNTFTVKILDFGLAKSIEAPQPQTMDQNNSVLGSVFYMAPEQLTRQPVDSRTDIYSLGAIFYYVLTGHPPFEGELVAQIIQGHLNQAPRPLSEFRGDLPKDVCELIHQMLAKKPAERPSSVEIIRSALRAAWGKPAASSTVNTTTSTQSIPPFPTKPGPVHPVTPPPTARPFVAAAPEFPPVAAQKNSPATLVAVIASGIILLVGGAYFLTSGSKSAQRKISKDGTTEETLNLRPKTGVSQTASTAPAPPQYKPPTKTGSTAPRAFSVLDPQDKSSLMAAIGMMSEVEGTIVRQGQNRQGTIKYLNFSEDFKDTLTLVFFMRGNERVFTDEALRSYLNKRVRVRGQISEHLGSPQIVISDLSQIEIIR
jgi:serine/threonine-protein kinase